MACRLTLLGAPRLLSEQGRLISLPAKAFALVAYILLTGAGAPVSRAALRQFLWESPDTKTAATTLRKFLLRIRQQQKKSGFELIQEERDHVRLAPSAQIDLARFLKIVSAPDLDDPAALCDLYRGELLEGLGWEEESREWLDVQRAKLRDEFVSVISKSIESAAPNLDRMSLRIVARRLIEVDPYNETGHRALMRLFAEEREPARVREVYAKLHQRLHEDLRVEPDAATTALYRSFLPADAPPSPPLRNSHIEVSSAPAAPASNDAEGDDVDSAAGFAGRSGAPRITILPPVAIGGQDLRHQLAVSLVEDITIGLCRFKALSVVAPHTAWELSASGRRSLFKTFGIDYAIEAQLQNAGGSSCLLVKLISAASREILWTEQYPFDRDHLDQTYRDLSAHIIISLIDTIERVELARYTADQDPTAYRLYLTGQKYIRGFDLPNVRRARRAFRSAIAACADYVPALSGLARTYQMEWLLMARGDRELIVEAEKLAHRALELDPDDARGHRELAVCRLYLGRFDESLEAFDRAEQRNPQHADLIVDFADALEHACEPARALKKVARALELNPICPDNYWWAAGGANYHLQRYSDALEAMSRMRDQSPAYRLMAAAAAKLGDREQARRYVALAREIHPDFSVDDWMSIVPIRDPQFARHYEDGLREAGFD